MTFSVDFSFTKHESHTWQRAAATIDRSGSCTVWNLLIAKKMYHTIKKLRASEKIHDSNGGAGIFGDAADGTVDGVVNLLTTALMGVHRMTSRIIFLFFVPFTSSCIAMKTPTPGIPAIPACKKCAANLVMVTMNVPCDLRTLIAFTFAYKNRSKEMYDDEIVTTGACAERKFVCKGMQASIEVFTSAGSQGAVEDEGTDTATLRATCNGAGTAWEAMGLMVTAVECSAVPACAMCPVSLITVDTANSADPGSKDMDPETPGMSAGCSTRTFTCAGSNPVIEVSNRRVNLCLEMTKREEKIKPMDGPM
ncbi:hypothetical protein PRIPAC_78544 [Pristionchus pacificus]|uniref:C6 domain-containing protein n=1 Tax=Pristionchus pacificus TaxID=54126 RepID=A0A2A6CNX7_PRIPA|nr:hypothetical protein PRIPAC_78544 [Pristionchus pacificus]|eukprot:PDM79820.1 hypothetical protein PRIPAC_32399 [Pristionchus pacificus]